MNGAREYFLAGSALTREQYRRICRRNALNLTADGLNGRTLADDFGNSVFLLEFFLENHVLHP